MMTLVSCARMAEVGGFDCTLSQFLNIVYLLLPSPLLGANKTCFRCVLHSLYFTFRLGALRLLPKGIPYALQRTQAPQYP